MYRYIPLLLILFLWVPLSASAGTVLRTGDKIEVGSDQVVEGDYYVSVGPLGSTVMSGLVTEDMYAFGATVTANGSIGGDFGAVTGAAFVHASVTDDVRIVSGETIIEDHVGGDVFVLSGVLKILSTATIDGDVVFYGGNAEINGVIGGSVYGSAENMRIDAVVAGDVDVNIANGFTLGGRADIAGDVRYSGFADVQRAQDAVIAGEIHKTERSKPDSRIVARGLLTPLFVTLFAALSLYLLFKTQLQLLIVSVQKSYLKSGLVGLATLLAAPFLSVILMLTVLGFLIGLLTLGFTLILIALGFSLSSVVLGSYLLQVFTKKLEVTLLSILLGSLVFNGLVFIPVLGPVLMVAVLAVTIGACALSIFERHS